MQNEDLDDKLSITKRISLNNVNSFPPPFHYVPPTVILYKDRLLFRR